MCSVTGVSDDTWRNVADRFVLLALETDSDSREYEINSPEHAASSGLYRFKYSYDDYKEDGTLEEFLNEWNLPTNLVLDRQLAKQLMPIFTEVASEYYFDSYDDEFEDW